MGQKLRVLIVEDNPSDAELVVRQLNRDGFDCEWTRVQTEADFLRQLDSDFDIIVTDCELPQFSAIGALQAVRRRKRDIPVIVVTGALDDETAVQCLRQGAMDYLLKDRLARLGGAVQRALHEHALQKQRQEVSAALQASEERFRALAENSPDIIYQIRPTHPPLMDYISPAVQRVLGYAPVEFYQDPTLGSRCIHPEDRLSYEAMFRGEDLQSAPIRHFAKDGHIVWLEIKHFQVRDPHNKVIAIQGMARDVTDRKRLEAQLYQAQKLETVGRLAGGIAHDFNNLLTPILALAELDMEGLGQDHSIYNDLREIHDAAQRASALTRQLLAFSRRQVLQPQTLDLNQLVTTMDKLIRRVIGEDIILTTLPAPQLGQARADPGQIEQVLMNLVVNARDAMPKGGKLTIETANVVLDQEYARTRPDVRPGEHVLLAVSDTGTGMTDEAKAHLFEPFFTTKEVGKGTGLGLATCYGIVKQSGWHIADYSELGQGTTVKVYHPLVHAAVDAAPRTTGAGPMPRGTETVLLVEDEAMVRELAARVLRRQGYTVVEAATGAEATRLVDEPGRIDLLLTDVVMPGMSGRELAEQLRLASPGVKLLFMSGYTAAALPPGTLDPGISLLPKPFTASELAHKVRSVLDG